MIKQITREKLEVEKYTACLHRAVNYRIYAESWYLDTVTNQQWDCLVLNDYEAIMPIPYRKKMGIKYIAQPLYCQQLGIFHSETFNQQQFDAFYARLRSKLVKNYQMNEENLIFLSPPISTKINQVLDLSLDYTKFRSGLRKNRKQELQKGLPQDHQIISSMTDQFFIDLLSKEYQSIQDQLYLKQLQPLVDIIQFKGLGITISIRKENEVVASSFYLKSGQRLIQLCNSKKQNSSINYNTFIVDYMIRNYLNQSKILDFEGSSIKGVNEFNASFRASTVQIPIFKTKFL